MIVVALVASGHHAGADEARDAAGLIERARAEWQDLEYRRVIASADAVLVLAAASARERAVALGMKASALIVLGDEQRAAAVFVDMFAADHSYQLPAPTSPRILAVYRPARSSWELERDTALKERLGQELAALEVAVRHPARARGGRAVMIAVAAGASAQLIASVRLHYRRAGTHSYSSLIARLSGAAVQIDIPGAFTAAPEPYTLELFVEVLHESGMVLRREGSREVPLTIAVSAGKVPRPMPLYKRWWVWAGTGVLAIAVPILIQRSIDVGPQEVRGRWTR